MSSYKLPLYQEIKIKKIKEYKNSKYYKIIERYGKSEYKRAHFKIKMCV